jgi:hypothetical protein
MTQAEDLQQSIRGAVWPMSGMSLMIKRKRFFQLHVIWITLLGKIGTYI